MSYSILHIASILGSGSVIHTDGVIEYLLIDSRKAYSPATSLFFALKGSRRNGHQYIHELYKKGVRNFVVTDVIDADAYPEANFIHVEDSLTALQQLAAHHRNRFAIPVIGITGSNGKTIVKEWLYQLLHDHQDIIRSPKSYNSQIGVPLSVWLMRERHELAIFEAGISEPGEMSKLEKIIQPSIGILTTIGEAHSEGFPDQQSKAIEKLKLFANTQKFIYNKDQLSVVDIDPEHEHKNLFLPGTTFFSWSKQVPAWLTVDAIDIYSSHTLITASNNGNKSIIEIPFTDEASIDNAITCWTCLLAMGHSDDLIKAKMKLLSPVNMRLEMKKGINQCAVINDSYSADLNSLEIALNFLDQQASSANKTVILSDFLQTSTEDEALYPYITERLRKHHVSRLIGIGEHISFTLHDRSPEQKGELSIELYPSTEEFITQFRSSQFKDETILVKGARLFGFERIVQLLELKVHQTILEINLNDVVYNLKQYQHFLQPATKIMAMVKAFAYGSGGSEIAGVLQYHGVDYLGVAYADEGVDLRKGGIHLPIMVMNPEAATFDAFTEYQLEPDIYSFSLLEQFDAYLKQEGLQQYGIHIELETGMNRLGFELEEIGRLCEQLNATGSFRVQSIFTHLVASEDKNEDDFTKQQFISFVNACDEIKEKIGYSFMRHISNSAAILRTPPMQLDMVRLGIGLYGIDSAATKKVDLHPVATLRSTIAQLKKISKGETVSYNRKGVVERDSLIATVRIGYADGYSRRLGNGKGKMWVRGKLAPVLGTVCMDMTMLDVTDIRGIREGDEVIVFGKQIPIEQLASWAETIPYEIMTGISQRVKRLYYEE